MSYNRQKGNKFETRIADKIHIKLLEKSKEYVNIFESIGNEEIKPKRDFASGNFSSSDGDIDLGIAKKFFPVSIECKNWKTLDISLNSLFKRKFASLIKIWGEQALPKARSTGLLPVVVFKANRTEDFCFYDKNEVPLIPINNFAKIDNYIFCLFDDFVEEVIDRVKEKKKPFDK